MSNKLTRFLIGKVGVDSGQLMLCDPCYIESQWQGDDFKNNHPQHRRTAKGKKMGLNEKVDGARFPFPWGDNTYAAKSKLLGGRSMNEAKAEGLMEEIPSPPPSGEFSYQGCCEATLSAESAGQLNFKLGHAGAGVVFSSGYGDGCYPVYGYKNEDGRIVKVVVEMD